MLDFAGTWQAADTIVSSKLLEAASTRRRSRSEGSIRDDVSVGGPTLAEHATGAALVDEIHLFVMPVVIGAGKQVLPSTVRGKLDVLDERRFAHETVCPRYHTRADG